MSLYTTLSYILSGLNIVAVLGWAIHSRKIKDEKNEVNGISYKFSNIFMLFIVIMMGLFYMLDSITGNFLISILNFAFGVEIFREVKKILYRVLASFIITLSCIIMFSSGLQL